MLSSFLSLNFVVLRFFRLKPSCLVVLLFSVGPVLSNSQLFYKF